MSNHKGRGFHLPPINHENRKTAESLARPFMNKLDNHVDQRGKVIFDFNVQTNTGLQSEPLSVNQSPENSRLLLKDDLIINNSANDILPVLTKEKSKIESEPSKSGT